MKQPPQSTWLIDVYCQTPQGLHRISPEQRWLDAAERWTSVCSFEGRLDRPKFIWRQTFEYLSDSGISSLGKLRAQFSRKFSAQATSGFNPCVCPFSPSARYVGLGDHLTDPL
jgi:hypothetical protein